MKHSWKIAFETFHDFNGSGRVTFLGLIACCCFALLCFALGVAICSGFNLGTYSTPILNGHTFLELACEENRKKQPLLTDTALGIFSVFNKAW